MSGQVAEERDPREQAAGRTAPHSGGAPANLPNGRAAAAQATVGGGPTASTREAIELGRLERRYVRELASASALRSLVMRLLVEYSEDEENLDDPFVLTRDDAVCIDCIDRRGQATALEPRSVPSELVRTGALLSVRVRVERRRGPPRR